MCYWKNLSIRGWWKNTFLVPFAHVWKITSELGTGQTSTFHKLCDLSESGVILVLTFARAVPQARYKILGHKLGAGHWQVVPVRAIQSQWPIISWNKLQQGKKDGKSCILKLLQASEALEGWLQQVLLGAAPELMIQYVCLGTNMEHSYQVYRWCDAGSWRPHYKKQCMRLYPVRHSCWVSEPTSANFCSSFWCDPFSPGHRLHFSH